MTPQLLVNGTPQIGEHLHFLSWTGSVLEDAYVSPYWMLSPTRAELALIIVVLFLHVLLQYVVDLIALCSE